MSLNTKILIEDIAVVNLYEQQHTLGSVGGQCSRPTSQAQLVVNYSAHGSAQPQPMCGPTSP
jgi:hypothetical protein